MFRDGSRREAQVMWRRRLALLILAAFLSPCMPLDAKASMTIEGDAGAIAISVADVSRDELVASIAEKFRLQIAGQVNSGADPIHGSFRGDLGDVLARILTENNFLIVYEGGQPARVLLSDRGGATGPVDPSFRTLQPGVGLGLGGGQPPVDPTLQDEAEMRRLLEAEMFPPEGGQ